MFETTATIFVLLIWVTGMYIYHERKTPSSLVLKGNEPNWEYVYLFSIDQASKKIARLINRRKSGNYKIGEYEVKESSYVSKHDIKQALIEYRKAQIFIYDQMENKTICEIADLIMKNEGVQEVNAVSKAFWLSYGKEPNYRKVFSDTIFKMCKCKMIRKTLFRELEGLYYQ